MRRSRIPGQRIRKRFFKKEQRIASDKFRHRSIANVRGKACLAALVSAIYKTSLRFLLCFILL